MVSEQVAKSADNGMATGVARLGGMNYSEFPRAVNKQAEKNLQMQQQASKLLLLSGGSAASGVQPARRATHIQEGINHRMASLNERNPDAVKALFDGIGAASSSSSSSSGNKKRVIVVEQVSKPPTRRVGHGFVQVRESTRFKLSIQLITNHTSPKNSLLTRIPPLWPGLVLLCRTGTGSRTGS